MARKATVIDPGQSRDRGGKTLPYSFCSGQDAEARLAWQRALDIYPGARWPNYLVGYLDLKEGKLERRAHPFPCDGRALPG